MDTVSQEICKSAPVHNEEAAEEGMDHAGEIGKFRSLWRMTGG
jgi:hypothetical protein